MEANWALRQFKTPLSSIFVELPEPPVDVASGIREGGVGDLRRKDVCEPSQNRRKLRSSDYGVGQRPDRYAMAAPMRLHDDFVDAPVVAEPGCKRRESFPSEHAGFRPPAIFTDHHYGTEAGRREVDVVDRTLGTGHDETLRHVDLFKGRADRCEVFF
jgi:hypothetical protein